MVKIRKRSLGPAFTEELSKVTVRSGHFQNQKEKAWEDLLIPNFKDSLPNLPESSWKPILVMIVTTLTFFAIFLRLYHLQIVKGSEMRKLADGNRVQTKIIHAPRGVIYDRNGKILAANSPGFRLTDPKTREIQFISREEALELEVKNSPLAANLEVDSIRFYPKGEETAHVLGYLGEISADQMKMGKYQNYSSGDLIGLAGIEQTYEDSLRGKDGGEIIEVDSNGKKVRTIRQIPPIPGKNLVLTIDSDLQHLIYTKLKEATLNARSCCAAAILENPQNGEILALVSIPSFDSNIFSKNINENAVAEVLSGTDSPILNRSISGTYAPGSTFKIVSSLAALSSGKITPQTIFEDTGEIFLGPYKFTNWYFTQYGRKEGSVDMVKAIQRSNDIYFYRVGELIGEKTLGDWAKKVGMGDTLGIDLSGEAKGLIPDGKWKKESLGQVWYPGDTLHMVIGQGFILTTPLQVLGLTAFIAADGILYQPHLALKVISDKGQVIREFEPKILITDVSNPADVGVIQKGLELVPQYGGTAWPFFTFPIKTAGKTGTAEYGDPKDRTHAWYSAYAPADDPKIAAVVLIEGGGEGSSVSAPVVKEIFRWFLSPDKTKLIKDIGGIATDSARTLGE